MGSFPRGFAICLAGPSEVGMVRLPLPKHGPDEPCVLTGDYEQMGELSGDIRNDAAEIVGMRRAIPPLPP